MKNIFTSAILLLAVNLPAANLNLTTSQKQTAYEKFCSEYNKKEIRCAKSQLAFTEGTSFWSNDKVEVSAKASSMLSEKGKLAMNYAELLTLTKHNLNNKVFVTAGTFASKNIKRQKQTAEEKNETQLQSYFIFAKRNIKALDFGSIIFIGYKASCNLVLNAGLCNSFSKLIHPFQSNDKSKADLKVGINYFFGQHN